MIKVFGLIVYTIEIGVFMYMAYLIVDLVRRVARNIAKKVAR